MIDASQLKDINPQPANAAFSSTHVQFGMPIPKTARLEVFSPAEWEAFVEEWASSLKSKYSTVKRFSGAGDMGIDVAAFYKGDQFKDGWDIRALLYWTRRCSLTGNRKAPTILSLGQI